MILSPYFWLGLVVALGISGASGWHMGVKYERGNEAVAKVKEVEKIVYRDRIINVEVPKIVTKVVEKRVEVEKESAHVITVIPKVVPPDCVLPDGFGMLLATDANGIDPEAPGGAATFSGSYGCREVLAAVLKDLEAGRVNSERLAGLQRWVEVVTQ